MTNDIVERLRETLTGEDTDEAMWQRIVRERREAADEIVRLGVESARLRSAVRALLDADDYWLRGNVGNEWAHRMSIAREVASAALAKEPGHE